MKISIMFPNEESFYCKMSREIFENYKSATELYQSVIEKKDLDIKSVYMKNSNAEENEKEKQILTMAASVANYKVLQETYDFIPEYLIGYGIGSLSALVCAEAISIQTAIKAILHGKIYSIMVHKPKTPVISSITGNEISNVKEVLSEIQYCTKNKVNFEKYLKLLENYKFQYLLDVGPSNKLYFNISSYNTKYTVGYLDKCEDNNYILENFEYKKFFNYSYIIRRILGIIVSTQNYNEDYTDYDENVLKPYNFVKSIVDNIRMEEMKQKTGEVRALISYEENVNECLEILQRVFLYKKTSKAEILKRIELLEQETMIELKSKFAALL